MLLAILLLISGASALIYQTIWVKQLGLVVGVDVYAVTITISAFFAGLSMGGMLMGRWADRSAQPLRLYAFLEIGIALAGLSSTVGLSHSAPVFVALQTSAGSFGWIIPFLFVGIPAFLMGGTLPILVREAKPNEDSVGYTAGTLYASNTAGAIIGTLAAVFVLIPELGIRGTALTAALGNVGVAILAVIANRSKSKHEKLIDTATELNRDARYLLVLYTFAGGIALGYEIIWSQAIVQFLSTRVYAFAIMLAIYLSGLVLGSALYSQFADRVQRPWMVFGFLISGAGVSAHTILAIIGPWLPRTQDTVGKTIYSLVSSDMLANSGRFALAAVFFVLLPTTLLGAAFPAAMRIIRGADRIGTNVGLVTALNTSGGIAGTFLTGFIFIPALGLVRTMGILAFSATVIGCLAILLGRLQSKILLTVSIMMIIMVVVIAGFLPVDKFAQLQASNRGGQLVYYEENPGGMVAVIEQKATHTSFRRLYIQGTSNSGDSLTSLRYMRLQALLPLLIHKGQPESALVVGLGTGITTGALLKYPPLKKRVCVELLPAVVHAAEKFEGNYNATFNNKIEIRIRDGRHELLRNKDRYDIITLEPPPPTAAGVVNLYSTDFYRLCRDRLNPNGLMAQWWPLPTQNEENSQSLVRSFIDVFPYVTCWTTELHEMLLIGSMDPFEISVKRISDNFQGYDMETALGEVGIDSPAALLATYITDRDGLDRYVGDAKPVTDNYPSIEYAGWVRDGEFARVLKHFLIFRSDMPLIQADANFLSILKTERESLMYFYQASLHAYNKEFEQWGNLMIKVLAQDGENPYYRWFIGK